MLTRPTGRRRLRLRLRHPVPYWLAVAVLATLTVSSISRAAAAADAARDRWGDQVAVAVSTADAEPGETVRAALRLLPAGLVPAGAARVDVDGARAATWIGRGEIVLERRLAPAGLSPTAALLPPGTRGVAVPQGIAPLPVVVGDRVDVLAPHVLAEDAVVVAVTDDAVTVAVRSAVAPRLVDAVAVGTVSLALSGTTRSRPAAR